LLLAIAGMVAVLRLHVFLGTYTSVSKIFECELRCSLQLRIDVLFEQMKFTRQYDAKVLKWK
jgi:hypothetical protein